MNDHNPQSSKLLIKEESKVSIESQSDKLEEEQKHQHFDEIEDDYQQLEHDDEQSNCDDQSYFSLKRSEDHLHINVRKAYF